MKFFADHNVTESVCRLLEELGHDVTRLRDAMPTDAEDPVVARFAQASDAILISHDRDFNQIAPHFQRSGNVRFKTLSRIHLQCKPTSAEQRVREAISLVEFEWKFARSKRPQSRMRIVIQEAGIKTYR